MIVANSRIRCVSEKDAIIAKRRAGTREIVIGIFASCRGRTTSGGFNESARLYHTSLRQRTANISIQSAGITICVAPGEIVALFCETLKPLKPHVNARAEERGWDEAVGRTGRRRSFHLRAESSLSIFFSVSFSMQRAGAARIARQERGEEEEKIGLSGLLDRQR